MEAVAHQTFVLFLQYGYVAIFVGVMLDNAGFLMPGEVVLLLAGSLLLLFSLMKWLVLRRHGRASLGSDYDN